MRNLLANENPQGACWQASVFKSEFFEIAEGLSAAILVAILVTQFEPIHDAAAFIAALDRWAIFSLRGLGERFVSS